MGWAFSGLQEASELGTLAEAKRALDFGLPDSKELCRVHTKLINHKNSNNTTNHNSNIILIKIMVILLIRILGSFCHASCTFCVQKPGVSRREVMPSI